MEWSGVTSKLIGKRALKPEERIYVASQWKLMWLHFRKHRIAVTGLVVIIILYAIALFSSFLSPYEEKITRPDSIFKPPQLLHFYDGKRFSLRPFVYGTKLTKDLVNFSRTYEEDKSTRYYLRFLVHGDTYSLFGLLDSNMHLFGVDEGGTIFLLGTDELGRDVFSRILYGSTISLSVGLFGVAISFFLGIILGGISGYYKGLPDNVIQRVIEFLTSMPTIPLWMGLSAAVPSGWPALKVYIAITLILSFTGWCGLARIVRSKLLETREEDFVMAARLSGISDWGIIWRHLLPSSLSYLIVHMTFAIPGMIMGETALSFLGLGLRPPVVSWGVMLQQAQNFGVVVIRPWLMWPAAFVFVTVLAFNFMGDGLRDAADPYKA